MYLEIRVPSDGDVKEIRQAEAKKKTKKNNKKNKKKTNNNNNSHYGKADRLGKRTCSSFNTSYLMESIDQSLKVFYKYFDILVSI